MRKMCWTEPEVSVMPITKTLHKREDQECSRTSHHKIDILKPREVDVTSIAEHNRNPKTF